MKTLRSSLYLLAICNLLIGSTPARGLSASTIGQNDLSPATMQELEVARNATARYHNLSAALADGYVNFDLHVEGEGFHYIKWSLLDGTFDPAHPEMLLYTVSRNGNCLELAGVEYLVPKSETQPVAPDGFTGDADQWRNDAEGFGLWELNAWIWLENPEGVFAHDNPRAE